jgi:hypothetical protein
LVPLDAHPGTDGLPRALGLSGASVAYNHTKDTPGHRQDAWPTRPRGWWIPPTSSFTPTCPRRSQTPSTRSCPCTLRDQDGTVLRHVCLREHPHDTAVDRLVTSGIS